MVIDYDEADYDDDDKDDVDHGDELPGRQGQVSAWWRPLHTHPREP